MHSSNLTVPYTTTYYIMQVRSKNKEPVSTLGGMPSETYTRELDHKVQFVVIIGYILHCAALIQMYAGDH